MDKIKLEKIIREALLEDMPFGDITTDNVFDRSHITEAVMIAKDKGVICGIGIALEIFKILDEDMIIEYQLEDGDTVEQGDIILEVRGKTRAILKGERTALNFMQRLSGIATETKNWVDEVKDFDVKIADTRKTTPLLRELEKYAVRTGGGNNHRFCLSDAVMLKDNHIDAMGGMKAAVEQLRKKLSHTIKIEIEADSLEKVQEALEAGADIIMLDNMSTADMETAVDFINSRAITEASGNVTFARLRKIAATGVDVISSGSLTHSVKALDISMRLKSSS